MPPRFRDKPSYHFLVIALSETARMLAACALRCWSLPERVRGRMQAQADRAAEIARRAAENGDNGTPK